MLISYWAIVSARFRSLLQYRAAALAGVGTQLFWGLIRVMIFQAFYRSSTTEQPMNIEDVSTYIWLGQAFLILVPWNLDTDLRAMIRTGNIGYELIRPVHLYGYWYCCAVAGHSAPVILRAVPIFVFAGAFMNLQAPASLAAAAAFVLSLVAAALLSSTFTTLFNVSMLWTISGEGIAAFARGFVYVFSGMIVPLPLFPDWTQPAIALLPFRGFIDTPFRIYLGHIPTNEAVLHLAHQMIWIVLMMMLGNWLMSRSLRRLVVQGG